ncbi:MAG: tetraacyldisaccharide 4'-kinase [Robiginitomaculum sp.]|nr:tetraacyldisaccharide 4'-kinase [Robiginitomaculum sp.]
MKAPAFWNEKHGRAAAPLTRTLLTPLSWIYSTIAKNRYEKVQPTKLSVPVICVGNITLGGSGKTPLAMTIAKALLAEGKNPAFISRGYGGSIKNPTKVDPTIHSYTYVGDEPLLLAEIAPVFIGKDRLQVAQMAIEQGAGCLIMDDGFQNPYLHKDLAIITIDTGVGHGNGRVFPAGPLREPVAQAVLRADAIVLIGEEKQPNLTGFTGKVLRSYLQTPDKAPSGKLIAFAGIGRPEKFFASLRAAGADLEQEIAFADHQPYTSKDVVNLFAWATSSNSKLITTTKDLMRWPEEFRNELLLWPVELVFDHANDIGSLLQEVLPKCR